MDWLNWDSGVGDGATATSCPSAWLHLPSPARGKDRCTPLHRSPTDNPNLQGDIWRWSHVPESSPASVDGQKSKGLEPQSRRELIEEGPEVLPFIQKRFLEHLLNSRQCPGCHAQQWSKQAYPTSNLPKSPHLWHGGDFPAWQICRGELMKEWHKCALPCGSVTFAFSGSVLIKMRMLWKRNSPNAVFCKWYQLYVCIWRREMRGEGREDRMSRVNKQAGLPLTTPPHNATNHFFYYMTVLDLYLRFILNKEFCS